MQNTGFPPSVLADGRRRGRTVVGFLCFAQELSLLCTYHRQLLVTFIQYVLLSSVISHPHLTGSANSHADDEEWEGRQLSLSCPNLTNTLSSLLALASNPLHPPAHSPTATFTSSLPHAPLAGCLPHATASPQVYKHEACASQYNLGEEPLSLSWTQQQ